MDFDVSDLETVARVAQQIDANPLTLAGRLVGLGEAEQRAGIPTWAWVTAALGLGVAAGVVAIPMLRARFFEKPRKGRRR